MNEVTTIPLGELAANCHIVNCGDVCAAVDIGNDPEQFLTFLNQNHLTLAAILLTHGHYDHIGGVEAVRAATGATVYIHEEDAHMLQDGKANLSYQITSTPFISVKEFRTVADGAVISVGNRTFHVMHTPGHTSGGVCYRSENLLFSGDTLFRMSIGRTDLGGNVQQMQASLQTISRLEGEYRIYPGHFESTTLEYEKNQNPYLRRVSWNDMH